MRINALWAILATVAFGVANMETAGAADFGYAKRPAHARYQSYSRYEYLDADPYAYSYSPRGYYPYYNSGYWGPPRIKRFRTTLPPYFAAWGAPDRYYRHAEWHERHYGGHRRGNW